MQKRTTGILAWAALALLIGVPGSEYLFGQDKGENGQKSAMILQDTPLAPQKTEETAMRHVGGAPIGRTPNKLVPVGEALTTMEVVTEAQADLTVTPQVPVNNVDTASLDEDGFDGIPPYPAPYPVLLERVGVASLGIVNTPVAVPTNVVIAARSSVETLTTRDGQSAFLQDWSEAPSGASYVVVSGAGEVLEPFSIDEFRMRRQQTNIWRATSQTSGAFEEYLPPTRGSRVRLDLLQ